MAGIWEDVFGLNRISLTDDFFDLGGHSLLASQVCNRARQVFRVELSLQMLFESPTVVSISESILDQGHSQNINVEAAARIFNRVNALSDEEAEALLASKTSQHS